MSDTPKTDKAIKEHQKAIWTLPQKIVCSVNSTDMAALERQHNSLIAKLEALAKELRGYVNVTSDNEIGKSAAFEQAGQRINALIQEAKQ